MYEIGFPVQPVQRELQNLLDLGIVEKVSTLSFFFRPLRDLCGFTRSAARSPGLWFGKLTIQSEIGG